MVKDNHTRHQQAQKVAETCIRVLKERFGAHEVYIFGSLAGQSPWHSQSDIDLAVEGLSSEKYIAALSALWQLLPEGLELDLVPLEDAPPELVARIKEEIKMPEDPKEALKQDIVDELINLGRIVDRAKFLLQRLPQEPTFIEISAAGKLVHDFYNGVERIFERIAVRLGPGLLERENWHMSLLQAMESEVEGIRPVVIGHELMVRLLDYLRFRHRFCHAYGDELEWNKLHPLIEGLEDTLIQLPPA